MVKILTGTVLVLITLAILGCSGTSGTESIEAVWINPQISDSEVSIPLSEVENFKMTHFRVVRSYGEINFMAYMLSEDIYVRANVCPPCGSVGFSLREDKLVCERCATTFDAITGEGISGGCINYPKENVPYNILNGYLIMSLTDLDNAYEETMTPG
ncbi:MAG: DUF2318 domain-containing protein [Dehalococcoidia bacterium]|nr:MAG: DUF2318 domain-containing protein [Dehalococcoidia bacterium]